MSKTSKPKESVLEKYLVKRCREAGILCYKFSSPSRVGVPDRILVKPHYICFVELKREGEVPTKLQMAHLKRINKGLDAGEAHGVWLDNKKAVEALIDDLVNGVPANIGKDFKIITK